MENPTGSNLFTAVSEQVASQAQGGHYSPCNKHHGYVVKKVIYHHYPVKYHKPHYPKPHYRPHYPGPIASGGAVVINF